MEVKKIMSVPPEIIFKTIADSVIADINSSCKNAKVLHTLSKGVHFKKKIGTAYADCSISEYMQNKRIEITYVMPKITSLTSYSIHVDPEYPNECEVTFVSTNIGSSGNELEPSWFQQRSVKKNMTTRLKQIERASREAKQ